MLPSCCLTANLVGYRFYWQCLEPVDSDVPGASPSPVPSPSPRVSPGASPALPTAGVASPLLAPLRVPGVTKYASLKLDYDYALLQVEKCRATEIERWGTWGWE